MRKSRDEAIRKVFTDLTNAEWALASTSALGLVRAPIGPVGPRIELQATSGATPRAGRHHDLGLVAEISSMGINILYGNQDA
ncbi:MAG: hypothetical protein ACRDTT_03910, partial [Pseudonocardiaceae bacterium]